MTKSLSPQSSGVGNKGSTFYLMTRQNSNCGRSVSTTSGLTWEGPATRKERTRGSIEASSRITRRSTSAETTRTTGTTAATEFTEDEQKEGSECYQDSAKKSYICVQASLQSTLPSLTSLLLLPPVPLGALRRTLPVVRPTVPPSSRDSTRGCNGADANSNCTANHSNCWRFTDSVCTEIATQASSTQRVYVAPAQATSTSQISRATVAAATPGYTGRSSKFAELSLLVLSGFTAIKPWSNGAW